MSRSNQNYCEYSQEESAVFCTDPDTGDFQRFEKPSYVPEKRAVTLAEKRIRHEKARETTGIHRWLNQETVRGCGFKLVEHEGQIDEKFECDLTPRKNRLKETGKEAGKIAVSSAISLV